MPNPKTELISEIRVFYNTLVQVAEALHEDTDITLGARAVMEYLAGHGRQTVPQVARARRVTRQRIQTLVNELKSKNLVRTVNNPETRRSPLVELTTEGRSTLRRMQRLEKKMIDGVSLSDQQIKKLTAQLAKIRNEIEASSATDAAH